MLDALNALIERDAFITDRCVLEYADTIWNVEVNVFSKPTLFGPFQ